MNQISKKENNFSMTLILKIIVIFKDFICQLFPKEKR